ncbi:MAG TPA: RluA family pseudouridine synthase [Candidatus Bathyarchaeia archaeon]|nr:RluA family pseudouridine synthase [Candidatus Bathyarchaeia archaeon]
MTLLERLRARYPEASGRSFKQWLAAGRVEVNGRPCRDGRLVLGSADTVAIAVRRPAARFPAPLTLIHEDETLLVFVKPSGLLTIATERERERTAYRLIWDYLAAGGERPFIVHRLDRETSGLLVVAKSEAVKRQLQAQFEARQVERVYVALVEGRPPREEGSLGSRLVEDRSLRVRSADRGRIAITHYRVLERGRERTRLELRLGTGRRHQIRVQLAEAGCPIVGDRAHGAARRGSARLCLHATRLAFVHPVTGAAAVFESAPPTDWV